MKFANFSFDLVLDIHILPVALNMLVPNELYIAVLQYLILQLHVISSLK